MPDYITRLAHSGWVTCGSVLHAINDAGLPTPDQAYLTTAFSKKTWQQVDTLCTTLAEHFASARFADTATWGPVLVPHPRLLDTRAAMPDSVRAEQSEISKSDFLDESLPAGKDITGPRGPWTLVVTITSSAGLAMGSHNDVADAPATIFTINGTDTRTAMTRQVWGSLLLQTGDGPMPDSEKRDAWTFTLFPGEELIDGSAVSGTVLHGQARQRLGKPTRGIKSARVRPCLIVGAAS